MQILVFDTSLDKTYITLLLQDTKLDTSTFVSKKIKSSATKYHSAYLISQIKQILQENIVETKNLDAIGVNIGPGSFTGIRVCLTVAKIMAEHLNIRLVGVSSSEILSKVYLKDNLICPVIMDARRDMHYCYNPSESARTLLLRNDEIDDYISAFDKNIPVICDKNSKEMLQNAGFNAKAYEDENYELGEVLAGITLSKIKNIKNVGECHWSAVRPLYIQTPPVLG